jgi:hypothetical protein
MKKLHLKGFLAAAVAALSFTASAQIQPPSFPNNGGGPDNFYKDYVGVQLLVTEPTAVAGPLVYTIANEGTGGTNEWGGAISSPILDLELVKAVPDSLACVVPTNSMSGKAAFIFRGDCEFGAKALAAQNAGASLCIIVNHTAGGPVGMGAGAVGASVTIPVVMISKEDGAILNARLNNSQTVKVSFTTWGFGLTNDLAILRNGVSVFHSFAIPRYQLAAGNGNPEPYKGYDGAFIANLGAVDQTGIKLKSEVTFQPADQTPPVLVRADSVSFPTFNTIDSILAVGMNNSYNLHPTQNGRYNVKYTLSSSANDEFRGDNTSSYNIHVTDDVFCKSRYDAVKDEPIATTFTRFAGGTQNVFGNLYYNAIGGHRAISSKFTIFKGPDLSLENTVITGFIFKWKDSLFADSLVEFGELELVGVALKDDFTNTDSGQVFYELFWEDATTQQEVVLEANTWYLVALDLPADATLGFDGIASFFPRSFLRHTASNSVNEFASIGVNGDILAEMGNSPNFVATHYIFDAGDITAGGILTSDSGAKYSQQRNGFIPAISLRTSIWPNSVQTTTKAALDIKLYPNPAQEVLNVAINLDKPAKAVTYTIIDLTGKRFATHTYSNVQKSEVSLPLNDIPNGVYLMYIIIDGKMTARQFAVNR